MNEELRQPSTHTLRQDRRMGKDKVEIYLEDWGTIRRKPDIALDVPHKTSLKIMEEMRPERLKNPIPIIYYRDHRGKLHRYPAWLCAMWYDLKMMWVKNNQHSTRVTKGSTPSYMPIHWYAKINQAIGQLSTEYQQVIILRYEKEADYKTACQYLNIGKSEYYDRLKEAKKIIKRLLK